MAPLFCIRYRSENFLTFIKFIILFSKHILRREMKNYFFKYRPILFFKYIHSFISENIYSVIQNRKQHFNAWSKEEVRSARDIYMLAIMRASAAAALACKQRVSGWIFRLDCFQNSLAQAGPLAKAASYISLHILSL